MAAAATYKKRFTYYIIPEVVNFSGSASETSRMPFTRKCNLFPVFGWLDGCTGETKPLFSPSYCGKRTRRRRHFQIKFSWEGKGCQLLVRFFLKKTFTTFAERLKIKSTVLCFCRKSGRKRCRSQMQKSVKERFPFVRRRRHFEGHNIEQGANWSGGKTALRKFCSASDNCSMARKGGGRKQKGFV